MKKQELSGQKFGRLTVVNQADNKSGRVCWKCECECGNIKTISAQTLLNGGTKSCGCLRQEMVAQKNTKHGKSIRGQVTPEYLTWCEIIKRTENPSCLGFKNYGGRGISICKEWRESFAAFLNDMGKKPTPLHSIERIDNNKNYCPENCKWVTRDVQNKNKRNTISITHQGISLCAKDWAERNNIKPSTVYGRLSKGWNPIKAITQLPK